MNRHGKNIGGLARSFVTVADPATRRALEALRAPDNYDPECFEFVGGRLTVRREWVQAIVTEMLENLTAETASGEDVVDFEVVSE